MPGLATRRRLGIPDPRACLFLRTTVEDPRGRVVTAADCIYGGDRCQLSAHVPVAFGPALAAPRVALRAG